MILNYFLNLPDNYNYIHIKIIHNVKSLMHYLKLIDKNINKSNKSYKTVINYF